MTTYTFTVPSLPMLREEFAGNALGRFLEEHAEYETTLKTSATYIVDAHVLPMLEVVARNAVGLMNVLPGMDDEDALDWLEALSAWVYADVSALVMTVLDDEPWTPSAIPPLVAAVLKTEAFAPYSGALLRMQSGTVRWALKSFPDHPDYHVLMVKLITEKAIRAHAAGTLEDPYWRGHVAFVDHTTRSLCSKSIAKMDDHFKNRSELEPLEVTYDRVVIGNVRHSFSRLDDMATFDDEDDA